MWSLIIYNERFIQQRYDKTVHYTTIYQPLYSATLNDLHTKISKYPQNNRFGLLEADSLHRHLRGS